jgi:hypothetical protein
MGVARFAGPSVRRSSIARIHLFDAGRIDPFIDNNVGEAKLD